MENFKTLTSNLNSYSEINSRIDQLNKVLSDLRLQRSELEQRVLHEINRLNLQNKKMKINNSHFFLGFSKQSPQLNYDLIETIGTKIIGKSNTELLISEIKKYREENLKRKPTLKRRNIKIPKKKGSKKALKEGKSQSLKRKV